MTDQQIGSRKSYFTDLTDEQAASVICWWIHWVCCLSLLSPQQIWMTVLSPRNCCRASQSKTCRV